MTKAITTSITVAPRIYPDKTKGRFEWTAYRIFGQGTKRKVEAIGHVWAKTANSALYKATMIWGRSVERASIDNPEPKVHVVYGRKRSLYTGPSTQETVEETPMAKKRKGKGRKSKSGVHAYVAGRSCGRGRHSFRSVGSYSVCVKCGSRKTHYKTKGSTMRRKVGKA